MPFTAAELQTLLQTAQEHAIACGDKTLTPFRRHVPFLFTLATTGMRFGEAAALQVKDIDWQHQTITVERAFVCGRIGLPKHDKVRRVHVPEGLLDVLALLIAERFDKVKALDAEAEAERQVEAANLQLDAWLFPDTANGPMNSSNFRRRVWTPLPAAAKVQHRKLHNLRHTYASLMLQAGRSISCRRRSGTRTRRSRTGPTGT